MLYSESSSDFLVEVEPTYVPEHSSPEELRYFFAYRVRITNQGEKKAQLLRRHWIIVDGHQNREDVEGPGVVGEQPVFEPGTTYEYTSFCPLTTPTGSMRGTFEMAPHSDDENAPSFNIKIPLFFLRDPSHDQ